MEGCCWKWSEVMLNMSPNVYAGERSVTTIFTLLRFILFFFTASPLFSSCFCQTCLVMKTEILTRYLIAVKADSRNTTGQKAACGIWGRRHLSWYLWLYLLRALFFLPCSFLCLLSVSPPLLLRLTRGTFQPPNLFLAICCLPSNCILANSFQVF